MNIILGWRVHEVKVQQVLHVQRLQQQDCVAQVGALNLRDSDFKHLVSEGCLSVKSPAQKQSRSLMAGHEQYSFGENKEKEKTVSNAAEDKVQRAIHKIKSSKYYYSSLEEIR